MRYGGIKLAKPTNYSANDPRLATESGASRVFNRCQPEISSWQNQGRETQPPIAMMPALAIWTSSVDLTPDTPTAPRH